MYSKYQYLSSNDIFFFLAEFSSFTPKHILNQEEKLQRFYQGVQKDHHELCVSDKQIECLDPPPRQIRRGHQDERKQPKPIMITPPDISYPDDDCLKKTVRFEDDRDRCEIDQHDICDLKREKTHCDCTDLEKRL